MRNVSDKSCRGNQNTHFVFDNFFFYCAVCKIMWKNTAELDRPQITIQHMCTACLIYKATNTYSEHEIFITFFTATMVARTRLTVTLYVHCLSCVYQNIVCDFVVNIPSSKLFLETSLICCNCTQSLQENHRIYEYLKISHNCSLQHSSLLISNHPVTWLYHDNKNYQEQ